MGDRAVTIEPRSPTWQAVKAFAENRIAQLQLDNESPVLGAADTAFLRGHIAALREVLNLPASRKKPATAPDPYGEVLL